MLAGRELTWDWRYVKDRLLFEAAGGLENASVGPERTTFGVAGTDNQLDYLLVGLRRWVREGLYDDGVRWFAGTAGYDVRDSVAMSGPIQSMHGDAAA